MRGVAELNSTGPWLWQTIALSKASLSLERLAVVSEGGREGGREEGGREGRKEGGREKGREREGGREGGREERKERKNEMESWREGPGRLLHSQGKIM